jgi:dTDP-4-amino-4,6-dideoxygalactose transaminase
MTGPIRWCGATPVFYRLDDRLNIRLDDLRAKLGARSRCVIVVHYFGFPQSLTDLRALCDVRRVALLEDCAHALFGRNAQGVAIGTEGDFAVGSLLKFFPTYDGGCLTWKSPLRTPIVLASGGARFQVKAVLGILQRAAEWGRLGVLGTLVRGAGKLRAALRRAGADRAGAGASPAAPSAAEGGLDFDPAWHDVRMSAASEVIVKAANTRRIVERRREHYSRLSRELAEVPGGRPLLPSLPEGVVPYVLPFVLEKPAESYPALRRAGVPIYRWEGVARDACDVAKIYETRLVQFPCHQELTETEVTWLIATVRRVLAQCDELAGDNAQSDLLTVGK